MMAETIKILQSDLREREPTPVEQTELNRRTEAGEELFDKEEGKVDNTKPLVNTKGQKVDKEGHLINDEGKKVDEDGKVIDEGKKTGEGELSDEELLGAEDKDLNDEQKTHKADLVKAQEVAEAEKEDKRILEAKDEDLDEKGKARKAELVKAKEGAQTEEEQKTALDEEVKAYATEHSVSEEDARKDLESVSGIQEKYKNDAKKVSVAYLHTQRAYDLLKEENKTLKNAPPPMPTEQASIKSITEMIEGGKIVFNDKSATKEELIEAYRKQNTDLGDDVTDDTVVKFIARSMLSMYASKRKDNLTKLSSEAKDKKAKLISELSESDKKFLPTIKSILENHTDRHIMSDQYSIEDVIFWAKGKESDKLVKEADAVGFKRGVEARRIIGAIKTPAEGKTKTKKGAGDKTNLNDAQKKTAESYFANDDISLEMKYELYADILEHDKKLKKDKDKK